MKSSLVFIALSLFLLLGLYSLSSGKHPPLIPKDIFHAGVTNDAACTTCHTPGTQAALQKAHPPKLECLTCHRQTKE